MPISTASATVTWPCFKGPLHTFGLIIIDFVTSQSSYTAELIILRELWLASLNLQTKEIILLSLSTASASKQQEVHQNVIPDKIWPYRNLSGYWFELPWIHFRFFPLIFQKIVMFTYSSIMSVLDHLRIGAETIFFFKINSSSCFSWQLVH